MENEKDIRLLQSRFSTATEIHCHKDSNGNTAQCCKIAQFTMESSIIACGSKSGLSGVLDYLQSKFRWGLRQEKYYCNCLKADSLACGASTAIACWALEYFRDIDMLSAYDGGNFSVVAVQTIDQCSAENANLWRSEIKKRGDDSAKWICDSCNFHECIGIIDMKTRELSVWDFGEWRRPYSSRGTEGALLSIRLDTRCIGNASKLQDYRQLTSSKVNWDGFEMEFEKWTEVPSEASLCPLSILAQTNILGNIYSLNPETDAFKKSDTPVVYISGVQMG